MEQFKDTFDKKVAVNSLYSVKGTKATYIIFSEQGICTGAAASEDWAYKNSTAYWQKVDVQNGLFDYKVYLCKQVWWFNPNWWTQNLKRGIYHIYLRHGQQGGMSVSQATVLNVKMRVGDGNVEDVGQIPLDINNDAQLFQQNNGKICTTYKATIDLSNMNDDQDISVHLEIFSQNYQIRNYLLEGCIFVPVSDLQQRPPQLIYFNQDSKVLTNQTDNTMDIRMIKPQQKYSIKIAPSPKFTSMIIQTQNEWQKIPLQQDQKIQPRNLLSLNSIFEYEALNSKFSWKELTREVDGQVQTFKALTIERSDQDMIETTQAKITIQDLETQETVSKIKVTVKVILIQNL